MADRWQVPFTPLCPARHQITVYQNKTSYNKDTLEVYRPLCANVHRLCAWKHSPKVRLTKEVRG